MIATVGLPLERYRQEALAQHNVGRTQCKGEPKQYNARREQQAQAEWDQSASTDQFNHSGTIEYGETSYKKIPFDFNQDNGLLSKDK